MLRARPGGPAERFAGMIGGSHPAATFFKALLLGFAVLAGLATLLGLVVTDVLVRDLGLGGADQDAVEPLVADRSLVPHRRRLRRRVPGGAPLLPVLVGLVAARRRLQARLAGRRLRRLRALRRVRHLPRLLVGVPRERPDVKRLEDLPADASCPSGHTAASLAVYAGLVLLLTTRVKDAGHGSSLWALAAILPLFVAFSRIYQGMHHPLDVMSGLLIGAGAITVLLFACRSAEAAVRAPARARSGRSASRVQAAA